MDRFQQAQAHRACNEEPGTGTSLSLLSMDVGGVSIILSCFRKKEPGVGCSCAASPQQPVYPPPTAPSHPSHLSAMTSRSHKRRKASADGHVKDNGRPKAACAATGLAASGEEAAAVAAVATTSPEDYSSMECWDKRYRQGMFVEWYCGFDHVRPLFERFVPKVKMNARMYTKYVACFSWLLR